MLQLQAKETGIPANPDDIIHKHWLSDRAGGVVLLKVMTKSKATRMIRVGIKLTVADNENKNVIFPLTEVKENLFSNDSKQAFIFTKIDPSKDGWGDIGVEVNVKPGKTTQISTSYGGTSYGTSYGYDSGTTYSYSQMGGGVGVSIGTGGSQSFGPISTVGTLAGDDDKINCVNCNAVCFQGEDFCAKCGNSTTEYM